ncbi:MAG: tetratricopeptide repeat protein [Clostridiales bacterium]|nr:tetratricopeptide repeat protein [Clostridiales bacterium]
MSIFKDIYDIGKDVGEGASKKIEESRRKAELLTDPPPRVKENFMFREQLVEDLRRQIVAAEKTEDNKFLLSGFGGVGKTTVARALYHKLKDQCKQIGWVECRENGDLRASLLAAIDTGAQEQTDDNERFRQIKRLLRSATGETVLFLDNVDQPDPLLDQLTGYDITLVVTSRMERVEGYRSVPIPQLSENQCVKLFCDYCESPLSDQDAPVVWELVRLVSCHTLAVRLLAKGIPAGMGLAEYLDKLKTEGFKFPRLRFGTSHDRAERTVVGHLKKLFDLAKLDEEQTRVMQNLALMADSRTLPFEVREWIGCGENTLAALVRTGWLTQTGEGYEVHPLVREIVLLDPVPVEAVEQFLDFVTYKAYFQDGEDYRAVQFKLGIVEAVLKQVADRLEEKRNTAALYNSLGNVYDVQGEYARAEIYHKRALNILIKASGEDNLDTASIYNNLGIVYDEQGEYTQAEKCYWKALNIQRKILGENHPDTAGSYDELGAVYNHQGICVQAEVSHKKALAIRLKVLGEGHPDTANSYNNLGAVYYAQGKYVLAEECYQKALAIRLEVQGEDHLDTASSYDNLGSIYGKREEYTQAEKFFHKTLDIRLKVLGKDHPDTASSYNNLGFAYECQKKYDEAVELLLKAWKTRKQKLGSEHPETNRTKNNLRNCFPHIDHGDQDFDTWLNNQ